MTSYEAISILISTAALLVAGFSFWKSYQIGRQQQTIETAREQDRVLDRKSASLSARGCSEEKTRTTSGTLRVSRDYYVEISNNGQAGAKIKKIELDDVVAEDHPSYLRGLNPTIDYIAANTKVELRLSINTTAPSPQSILIVYDDESGADHIYKNPLTFR